MDNRRVYLVYDTDAWHSRAHRECKGIYISKKEAIEAIAEHHEIPLDEFNGLTAQEIKEQLKKDLETILQTQGYTINYEIETCLLNDWV